MRLTLRTLLAYLDDVLEPAKAKEIGAKIAESPFASSLVKRIREVVRRRRLTAPDISGPGAGLDPNTVAEYLDNALSPEKVADVERVCLESDMHLAEVAACHQVLALALGEPVEASAQTRSRMYALAPLPKPPSAAAAPDSSPAEPAVAAPESPAVRPFAETIPDHLRPRPLWRRLLPFGVAAAMIAVVVLLLRDDPAFEFLFQSTQTAATVPDETQDGPEAVEVAAVVPDPLELPAAVPDEQDRPARGDEPAVPEQPADLPVAGLDPPPPADEPEDAPLAGEPAAGQPARPEPPAVAVADPQPEPPAGQVIPVEYDAEGILLRHDRPAQDWFVLPRRSLLHTGETVAVPEPFDVPLNVGRGLLTATVSGGSVVRILPAGEHAPLGFGLTRGRLALQTKRLEGDTPLTLALNIGDEPWQLRLTSDTHCAVEIVPRQPERPDHELGPDAYVGSLYVLAGNVSLTDAQGRTWDVNDRGFASLTPEDRAAQDEPVILPLLTVPRWLDASRRPVLNRAATAHFAKAFDSQQPVSLTIPAVVRESNPYVVELAVKCLDLTGHYSGLAKALAESSPAHQEARLAAIAGLRTWLAESPENGPLLDEELRRWFPSEEVETVLRLLWGYGENDARNPITSRELVNRLEHSNVAIRELAFFHILRLTGLRYDYLPHQSARERQAAVNRWRTHLDREGALLGQ